MAFVRLPQGRVSSSNAGGPCDAWSDSGRPPQDCHWGSGMPLPGAMLHGAGTLAPRFTPENGPSMSKHRWRMWHGSIFEALKTTNVGHFDFGLS